MHLATAAACMMHMTMPAYGSEEVMKERLLFAVENCTDFQMA